MGNHEHEIEAVYPLSPAQEGILFHASLAGDAGIYCIQRLWTLPADLDRELFKACWQRAIQRHAILRTAFLFDNTERPLQAVGRQLRLPWEEINWSGLALEEEKRALEELLLADRVQGFEIERAPLMRVKIIQRCDGQLAMLWSFHHVILDGWSWPLVLREVYTDYRQTQQGLQIKPEPAPSYQEYIAWLQRQDLGKAEAFWRRYLKGLSAPTTFLPQGIDGQEHTPVYTSQQINLSPSLIEAMQVLMQRQHLTINTLFLGAWALLLNRYSGEREVIFGTAVSGRPPILPGVERMVGMFINTLPVRIEVREDVTVLSWLQDIQRQQAQVQQFEYSPLVQVQKWSDVPRGTALFEHILVCGTSSGSAGADEDAEMSLERGDARFIETTNYPLTLNAEPGVVQAIYDEQRFSKDTIQRLLAHMQVVLESLCANTQRHVGQIELLQGEERQQILSGWNATERAFPVETPITHHFEAVARADPQRIALVYEGVGLTYQELDQRSTQLARYLRKQGVTPDTLVVLYSERSPEMVVGLLGILKAGAAYVPLDPMYSAKRTALILADVSCTLVLTQAHLRESLPTVGPSVVCLDEDWAKIADESPNALEPVAALDHLAYVIYTSGSTGRPKGVAVTHAALANLLWGIREKLEITREDIWLAVTTISFDIAGLELYLPLLAGARVVLANAAAAADGYQLAALMEASRATILQATPVTWRILLTSGWSGNDRLQIISGGEALAYDLAQQLVRNSKRVWNFYGPTETTIWSSGAQIVEAQEITLGQPLANTQMYVLDASLRPVPIGIEGQLYIGGSGLARGYVGMPEMTAERFIPDPFSGRVGARLYQTGDRVRYRVDGGLEFLGRVDHQIKIRGFRIEPSEIEAIMRQQALVREAIVVALDDPAGHKRLVAYIVLADEQQGIFSVKHMQKLLRDHLPEYMVPALIIPLDALPLTPNGKVDRQALPDPGMSGQSQHDGYIEPRTTRERQLAQIWQQVLHVERVGIHDSFFVLGGDSILGIRVVARARQMGMHLTPRDMFQYHTIAELASVIPGDEAQELSESGEILPLTPIQEWFFARELPNPHHWNQAKLFHVREHLDADMLRASLHAVVEQHGALRLRFQRGPDGWQQTCVGWHAEDAVPLTLLDGHNLTGAALHSWIQQQTAELQKSLNLKSGPLFQVALIEAGLEEGQYLLFVIHHLAIDVSSWHILLHDWQTLYRQQQSLETISLPFVPTPFEAWTKQLEAHASSLRLMRERTYWLGLPWKHVRSIPVDFPGGDNNEGSAHTLTVALDTQETQGVLHDVTRVYHLQVHEALLAAWVSMQERWTGVQTHLIDIEGHGREDIIENIDLSRTVGWLTSVAPLCLNMQGKRSFQEIVIAVKEQMRAMPNGGIGYGLLRYRGKDRAVRQQLASLPQSEMVFHYSGRALGNTTRDELLVPADDVSNSAFDPGSPRTHLLAFEGYLAEDRLHIAVTYSEHLYRSETMEKLLHWYLEALRTLVMHCQQQNETYVSPQDFPEAGLDQSELDTMLASLYEQMES